MSEKLLDVKNLVVNFKMRSGEVTAIDNVSFSLLKGEKFGLVGESGAGKSVTGFSIIKLISKPGYIKSGEILFKNNDLVKLDYESVRKIRGNRISMIFQDPMMTLNPVLTIGTQMMETLIAHKNISKSEARKIAVEKLKKVHIPSPEKRLEQYPHEFSGGMRQRIIIAISLLTDPELIIADEPTTALDVTIQAEIMELLLQLCDSMGMGLILITHDLAVVSQVTDRMAVMYAGKIIEEGNTLEIIENPKHPYTEGLIAALPESASTKEKLNQIPGNMPGLGKIPEGCSFHPRCTKMMDICLTEVPELKEYKKLHRKISCHLYNEKEQ